MEEKSAKLKLFLSADGRLRRATLIIEEEQCETLIPLLTSMKEGLFESVNARILRRDGAYISLALRNVRRAASWMLDLEDATGISIQMVDQKGARVPLPLNVFRNPQDA